MRHLMSPLDFSVEELDQLMDLANDIEKHPEKYAHACDGKRLATLFYEPSTRTRLSFEAAMMNLGGTVLGFSSANSSSASKGESVADTIRVVSCFANICAMRHPKEGAPLVASMYSRIPVINAGDGGHQHPTQTLTDLLTIRSLKGRLNNLTIGFCGDLKFGRTVHSLIEALVRYTGIKIVLISPEELRLPDYITAMDRYCFLISMFHLRTFLLWQVPVSILNRLDGSDIYYPLFSIGYRASKRIWAATNILDRKSDQAACLTSRKSTIYLFSEKRSCDQAAKKYRHFLCRG